MDGEDADIATAGDLADKDFPTCRPEERAGDVVARLGEQTVCAVVDGEGIFLGRLRRTDAAERPEASALDLMATGASTFRPDVHATEMAEWFRKRKIDEFFITTPDGRLFGILYRSAVEHVVEHAERR